MYRQSINTKKNSSQNKVPNAYKKLIDYSIGYLEFNSKYNRNIFKVTEISLR